MLQTTQRKIREDINSPVAREAYSDFDLASAHESFCEYRKYMNPRFPRQTIRASMTMHPSVTADSDEVARITPPTIHPARGFALDTGNLAFAMSQCLILSKDREGLPGAASFSPGPPAGCCAKPYRFEPRKIAVFARHRKISLCGTTSASSTEQAPPSIDARGALARLSPNSRARATRPATTAPFILFADAAITSCWSIATRAYRSTIAKRSRTADNIRKVRLPAPHARV